jgi:hypothetical protein
VVIADAFDERRPVSVVQLLRLEIVLVSPT